MQRAWNWWSVVGASVLWAVMGPGCSTAPTVDAAEEATVEPGTYLADFDRAWELVRDTYHDAAFNGLDWDGVRAELRPRAEVSTRRSEGRMLINEMASRLGESHFGVIPEEAESGEVADAPAEATGSRDGVVGLDVRVVEGRAVVTRVTPGGPAERAGIRTGWVIERIGDTDTRGIYEDLAASVGERTARMYAWQAMRSRLDGAPASVVELTVRDGRDRRRRVTVERVEAEGEVVKFGNLPPTTVSLRSRWLTPEETGSAEARVGYIEFNMFMVPIAAKFERAMYEFRDADAVVIDLRGNIGGVASMCASMSRYFVTRPSRIGTMKMRGQNIDFNATPVVVTMAGERLSPFEGPVAILMDEGTASTSEFLAGGLRGLGRARTFGSASAGMALPAAMSRLPSGDVFMHAIADYVSSDGSRLEADGVPADEPVELRRADLLAGIDAPLRAAATWAARAAAQTAPQTGTGG